eukprot:14788477-Ditylum_brightwellii.AAC.1
MVSRAALRIENSALSGRSVFNNQLFPTDNCQQKEITALSPVMRRNQRLRVEEKRLPHSIDCLKNSALY